MNANQNMPPWPYSRLEYAAVYILGILAGAVLTAVGLFVFAILLDRTTGTLAATIASFAVMSGAIVTSVALRARRGSRSPFILGLLSGACIIGLIFGVCFFHMS